MFPLMVSSGGAEVEHGVGIGFFPPGASDLEAFLDDVTMAAFDLALSGFELRRRSPQGSG